MKDQKRISGLTKNIIDSAVNDVLHITALDPVVTHHVHHVTPVYPTVVWGKATPPPAEAPHSSVMRAVAEANEKSAMERVNEQRTVAEKMEKLEH